MCMALGNYVVVDIGEGRFAFYAHMQPGSLRVKPGDKVTTGQVLGLLGNSGNTDAPHLHFHVMDGASPLLSDGLPYAFTSFTGEGRVTDEQPLFSGGAAPIDLWSTARCAARDRELGGGHAHAGFRGRIIRPRPAARRD